MKKALKSQLESYKRDNDESSKEELYNTINSISSPTLGYDSSTLDAVEEAKKALTNSISNKSDIVKSVENVISSLN
ncbi:MAG: hypothetical protein GX962_16670 [Epulopiscium sp.]|nr:hypothetical protein [Candidatus Epulonipiscium sp.]